ncbi:MAG: adenylyltransferase/cytidyltransferase family protein [Parcubacteria group bacterium]|jgi:pantetheine-phosphate adenylyltransferase
MKTTAVYPGCFTPPTHGHFQIAKRSAEIFPEVTIICSTNEAKNGTRWFSEEECKTMWQHYPLPKNVLIKTFAEYSQEYVDLSRIIMIRGIRDENDMENEKRVMKLNKEQFGIDKIFYILAEKEFAGISASRARKSTTECDFYDLASCVSPAIVTLLLEKSLGIKNLFMVVGRPGSGKSTFLTMLTGIDPINIHINTDLFSALIKPLIIAKFGDKTDLVDLAITHDAELTAFVAPQWFQFLKKALQKVPKGTNVFLEISYGLKPGKELYRYIGHKVLYVVCEDEMENRRRITERGTDRHMRFITEIPDLAQSIDIAHKNRLELHVINSDGNICTLRKRAINFLQKISTSKEI